MFSRFAASAVLFALLAVAQAHEGIDNSGQIGGQRDGISAPSGGTSYFVNSISGLDTNNGRTPATAWQSITHVLAQVYKANDSVLFTGSQTITGSLALTTTTNPAGDFTIGSYGTGKATISSGNSAACITATNLGGITINGIVCTGGTATVSTTNGINFVNNTAAMLSGPTISNVTVSGYGLSCIIINAGSSNEGYNGSSVTNSTIHDCGGNYSTSAAPGLGIYVGEATINTGLVHANLTISHNTIYNIAGTATVCCGGHGIGPIGVNGFEIDHNIVHDNGSLVSNADGPVGIIVTSSSNGRVEYNEIYNQTTASTDGDGIDLDYGSNNIIVQYNWSHDNQGAGYLNYAPSSGALTWSNNTVRFNICQNDGPSFACIAVGAPGTTITGWQVYNNTVVQTNGGGAIGAVGTLGTVTGDVSNNVFYGLGTSAFDVVNFFSGASNLTFTGNDYFGNGEIGWSSSTYSTFATWQTATGQEKIGGVNVGKTNEPRLVAFDAGGITGGYVPASLLAYQLQTGSPMVGGGIDVTAQYSVTYPTTDYYGVAITSSAKLIGAGQTIAWTPGVGTCSSATTALGRMSSPPTATQEQANGTICSLVGAGVWSTRDAVYKIASDSATDAKLNLVSSSYGLTPNGTIPFTANAGYTGDGSTGYLDTGFIPPSANYVQNSAEFSVWLVNPSPSALGNQVAGGSGASGTVPGMDITPGANSGAAFFDYINDGTGANFATSSFNGPSGISRTGASAGAAYFQGVAIGSPYTVTSTGLSTSSIIFDALNVAVTGPTLFAPYQVAYGSFGSGLTAKQELLQHYIFNVDACATGSFGFAC